ncbi:hypothetical protein K523DRAFT_302580 [Schizophyllum commune Tattone D]|nr:hypothetical protein K523DRAFT_302580 [Schizophyllum commune Tattone D]
MSSAYGSTTIHDLPIELLVHVFLDVSSYDVANPEKLSHAPPVVLSHVCSRWRAIALDTPRLWTLVVLSQAACRSGLLPAFSQRRGEGSPVDVIYCPNPVHTTVSGEMVVMHSLLSDVSYRRVRTLIARYAWGANFPPQTPARHNHRARRRWLTRRSKSSHRGVAGSSPWEKPWRAWPGARLDRSRPMILRLWVPVPTPLQTRACRVTLPRRTLMPSKPSG